MRNGWMVQRTVVHGAPAPIALDQATSPMWGPTRNDNARMHEASPVTLPGLHTPAVGFEEPFGMLGACHERVLRSLALLRRLVDHLESSGLDDAARSAAHDVWRYFEVAAPAHHADEELHVLPRLRDSGSPWLADVARRIEADHAELHAVWRQLGPLLLRVHRGPAPLPPPELDALRQQAAAFVAIHDRHVPMEDEVAFPAVRRRMDTAALQAMGQEMAARRRQPA